MDNLLLKALKSYFKSVNIKISNEELELQLFSHPHTPSLYAITETLNFLKIDNVAAQVEHSQFDQLPNHFIAFIDGEKGKYFAHIEKKNCKVYLHNEKEIIDVNTFNKLWNGVILIAENDNGSIKPKHVLNKLIIFSLLVLPFLLLWSDIFLIVFCLIGMFGLFISQEIFKTTNTRSSFFGEKICGPESENGCNKVLNSKDYNLGKLSLNDFLFSFLFTSLAITILFKEFTSVHVLIYSLALVTILSTIFIQAFILKTWCRLCLMISLIIILQIVTIFIDKGLFYVNSLDFYSLIFLKEFFIYGFIFLIISFRIYNYRELKMKHFKLINSEIELTKFKRSPEIIRYVLYNAKKVLDNVDIEQIIFGNLKSLNTIRLVLSTNCSFCKKAFNDYYNFYLNNSSDYKFELIFNHYNTDSSKRNDALVHMINYYRNNQLEGFLEILHEWFNNQNVDRFFRTNLVKFTVDDYNILKNHREWCKENELFHTPILIINEKQIPPDYGTMFLVDIIDVINS